MLRKYGTYGLLTCVFAVTGCGGEAGGDGEIVDVEPVGEIAAPLVFGDFKLGVYDQGWWRFDANLNGVGDDPARGPFGEPTDLPLVGYGSNLDCGFGGGMFGVYRSSTDEYFFDANGNTTWDGADYYINDFSSEIYLTPQDQLFPIIWSKKVGAKCQGVIGSVVVQPKGGTLWLVDASGNGVWGDAADRAYFFMPPGTDYNNYPAPIWSATHNTTIMAVFNRRTGMWYVDKNNNKVFDNCTLDSCTSFGNPWSLPFSHPNSSRRGVSEHVVTNGVGGFWKTIDGNANGIWDNPRLDGTFPYYTLAPRAFIW
jgi:hypothetical protein